MSIKLSKKLSYILRHNPGSIGITLDPNGWAPISIILSGLGITREQLDNVVKNCNKQRYEIDNFGFRIRARQGHSIDIDLGYKPIKPPSKLYHGTSINNLEFIKKTGLQKMVGSRHGKPIVLTVDAEAMHKHGYQFFKTDNDVWLVNSVPIQFIIELADPIPMNDR